MVLFVKNAFNISFLLYQEMYTQIANKIKIKENAPSTFGSIKYIFDKSSGPTDKK